MPIREKKRMAQRELSRGPASAAFTLYINDRMPLFVHHGVVGLFTDMLGAVTGDRKCIAPAYCFMPDHLHLLISGVQGDSDIYTTVSEFKETTAYWMSKNIPKFRWRKDFSSHVIGEYESIAAEARDILDNPVRKGLVASWQDYPFKGAIGCRLEDVLKGRRSVHRQRN